MSEGTNSKHDMQLPSAGAVVRMYNTGLGDCFLVGFRGDGDKPRFMMIDCGSLKGTRQATPRMKRIMKSIAQATRGEGIQVLVATHRHWDHLSGFKQAKDEFERIDVEEVWLGWTENAEDESALRVQKEELRLTRSLRAAAEKLRRLGSVDAAANVRNLLEFEHGPGVKGELGATSTSDLLEVVRRRVASPRYLEPSLEPLSLVGASSVNVYVLGPPKDLAFMKKLNPSSGSKSEVYVSRDVENELSGIYSATELHFPTSSARINDDEARLLEATFPFDPGYGRWIGEIKDEEDRNGRFFRDHYGFSRGDRGRAWRRIELDWLEVSESLALQFDNYRNNTSVVLAIELGAGGPVLLFPADAQVGNWLSWGELKGSTTVDDLLSRTVLYKVGHHGSHNATLRKHGLERMGRSGDLVAMIPVDEDMARKPKGRNRNGWNMPYPALLTALADRTKGRVLRSDTGMPRTRPAGLDAREWRGFKKAVRVVDDTKPGTPLFVDYAIAT